MSKRQYEQIYYAIVLVNKDFYIFHYRDNGSDDKQAERNFLLNNYFNCREEAMAARGNILILNRHSLIRGRKNDRYWYIYKYKGHYYVTSKIDIRSEDDNTRWNGGNYFYCKTQAMKTLHDKTLTIQEPDLDDYLPW